MEAWKDFKGETWKNNIDVNDFIINNYTEYLGDDSFLTDKTVKTTKIWNRCVNLFKIENKKHILAIETKRISGINSFKPGYICKSDNVIVGLQTDKPLKLIVNLFGGIRMATKSVECYHKKIDKSVLNYFKLYRKSHNDGVFDAYTSDIRACRKSGLLTGLPDAYGRGRIIGDYRRVALYGIDRLIEEKQKI